MWLLTGVAAICMYLAALDPEVGLILDPTVTVPFRR